MYSSEGRSAVHAAAMVALRPIALSVIFCVILVAVMHHKFMHESLEVAEC